MAFVYMQESSMSFTDMEELQDYVYSTEESVSQIPLMDMIDSDACFFKDSRFGTQLSNYGFTEYSFKALCNLFSIPHQVISGISGEGVSSILLNDYLKSKAKHHDFNKTYLVVDTQQQCILGIVTDTYVYYKNMEFLNAINGFLGSSDARMGNVRLESAYYNNTRLFVRLITDIDIVTGIVTGIGGESSDRTKVGLQLTNSLVGDLPVRVSFYLLRLICANGLVAQVSEAIAVVKHSGIKENFDRRLQERISILLDKAHLATEMLTNLVDINFEPEQLVKAGYADSILNIIPEMRSTLRGHVSLVGETAIADTKERKLWRDAQYIGGIPNAYGRKHSLEVFSSAYRNNATLFDFINVLTEYAKELPMMAKLQVEERVGDFANQLLQNKHKFKEC